jgi:hypothetical protein
MEKQIVLNIGEKLEIVSKDLTIGDVIKGLTLLSAVIKDVEKTNPEIKYSEVMQIVDNLSDEIVKGNQKENEEIKKN